MSSRQLARRQSSFRDTSKARKSKKEEEKLIALIHPQTKQRIDRLFTDQQVSEVALEEFLSYMDSLQEFQDFEGINYNSGLIHKMATEEDRVASGQPLSKRSCFVLIGKFIAQARRHSDTMKREERNNSEVVGRVKHVDTLTYISLFLKCALVDKKYMHRWKGLPTVDPKRSLVMIVVVITCIMSIALIGFLSLVYISEVRDIARSGVKHAVEAFSETLQTTHPAIEHHFLETSSGVGKGLKEPVSNAFAASVDAVTKVTQARTRQFVALSREEENRIVQNHTQHMDSVVRTAYEAHHLLSFAAVTVKDMVMELVPNDTSIILFERHATAARYATTACTGCPNPMATSCVAHANASMVGQIVHTDELDVGSNKPAITSAALIGADIGVCVMFPLESLRDQMVASLSAWGAAQSSTGAHSIYYRDMNQTNIVHAGGPAAPSTLVGILSTASVDAADAIVQDGFHMEYYVVGLPAVRMFAMVVVRKEQAVVSHTVAQRVGANLHDADKTIGIQLGMRQNGGIVSTTGDGFMRRDPGHAPHIVLGLNGQSGALHSKTKDFQDSISGYTALEYAGSNLTISIERPRYDIKQMTVTVVKDLLGKARGGLEDWKQIAVYTKDAEGVLTNIEQPNAEVPAYVHSCFEEETSGRFDVGNYLSYCRYASEFQAVVTYGRKSSELANRMWLNALYAILVGFGLSLISFIIIRQLTRNVLDHIEKDYVSYKQQIEEEKRQFSELVKDVMPSYISKRIIAGEKLIVDQHPQLTFLFSDIVGFTETSRKMSTTEMVRLLGYMFMVEDGVAEYYNIHKIKTIGDAYFAVAGLDDLRQKQASEKRDDSGDEEQGDEEEPGSPKAFDHSKENNQVYRMVSFACVLQLLLSKDYVHLPERTECFKMHAGDSDPGPFRVLSMRMGIHSGPAIAGVVDVGRAPHFDCFGPSVNLSSRMESTAPVDRIQLSSPTHDMLVSIDTDGDFEFDPPRKTLVKGYGTIKTHVLKATSLSVPEDLIKLLHIDRAVKRRVFGEGGLGATSDQGSLSLKSKSQSQSIASSLHDRGSIASEVKEQTAAEPVMATDSRRTSGGSSPQNGSRRHSSADRSTPERTDSQRAMLPNAVESPQAPPPPSLPSLFADLPAPEAPR